jgi:chaperonin GroES
MKPVLSQILFKPFPSPEQTESGLFVPENARPVNNKGTIVAVGNGTKEKPMRLKVGDVGYRVQNWGEGFIMDGEIYFLMDASAIIATE